MLVIGLAIGLGCVPRKVEPVEAPAPEVTAALPVSKPVTEFYEYIGRTRAPQYVEVRARVSGYVTKIHFTDGKEVQAGEPLFEIDPRPYQFTLDAAQARLEQAEAQLRQAKQLLDRNRALLATNSVSQQDYEDAELKRDSAIADINAAKAAVSQADLDLKFCSIVAPISGRLSQTNVTVGNLISSNQSQSEPLTTIASVDPVYVLMDVDEAAVLRFRDLRRQQGVDVRFTHVRDLNHKVYVSLSNETDFPHEGFLDFVDNEVRTTTGTLLVRAELPNPKRIFAPGLFVRVRIPFGDPVGSLLIPDRAVLNDQNLKYVLVINEDNSVVRRDVELGPLDQGMRVIRKGITASDRVIINGLQRARPGVKVKATMERQ
jgi:RND family efflux transporter MFP subunit